MLKTEAPSDSHPDLDLYPTPALVDAFIGDQREALEAVRAAAPSIAAAVDAAAPRIAAGGRLLYVGAGTSGRLGVLDSVELFPTFSWPRERAVAMIAGGPPAMFEAVEGAEDSRELGAEDLRRAAPGPHDVVIVLAASGTTPYVMGALEVARAAGALTIGIANNPDAPVTREAAIGITLATGSEVISGSTRLKAGTAQKIALNTLSSAIMVRLHKVYRNLMVDVHPTNAKLRKRAVDLTMRAAKVDEPTARQALQAAGQSVKVAVVALLARVDAKTASSRLHACHGNVRMALADEVHTPTSQEQDMGIEDKPSAKGALQRDIDRDIDRDAARADKEGPRGSPNRDPITDAPGAHPVGVGVGAAAGGAAGGAAVGSVAGPVGTMVGAVAGAIIGGLAGKAVAEVIDPTLEDAYWREHYVGRDYVPAGATYDDYGPAYRYGLDSYSRMPDTSWEDAHGVVSSGWDAARGGSRLGWDDARPAAEDAWRRAEEEYGRSR